MSEFKDDKISQYDRAIAGLMEERQKRIDELKDPVRDRVLEVYTEIASLFDELHELGDGTFHTEEVYVGYDEHEDRDFPVSFEGKFFYYNNGKIVSK
jgi:hypothetical protein